MPVKASHSLPWVWRKVRAALFTTSIKQAKLFKKNQSVIILNVNIFVGGALLFTHTAKLRH